MKTRLIVTLGMALLSPTLFANDLSSSQETTARAYRAHLLTFAWPKENTVEQIEYETLLSLKATPKFPLEDPLSNSADTQSTGADIERINNPFDDYQKKLRSGVNVLTNNTWTLIFENRGSKLQHNFHSQPNEEGYAELTGSIDIKFGRYLESKITLKHYLFTPPPSVVMEQTTDEKQTELETNIENNFDLDVNQDSLQITESSVDVSQLPQSQLIINQNNKTASKKLNYLDHPTIGTLIYFEPIDLEVAIQQQALENLMSTIEQIGNTDTQQ